MMHESESRRSNPADAGNQRPPPCLPGFGHVSRFVDMREAGASTATILPGQYYVTRQPEVILTVLGSCIAVCAFDLRSGIGGMNHFMLPEASEYSSSSSKVNKSALYGSFAMEKLVNDILRNGGSRERLQFKIFGGGSILPGKQAIGRKNIEFVKRYLADEGYDIVAEDVGSDYPRKVKFYALTGKVQLKRVPRSDCSDLLISETKLDSVPPPVEPQSGELDLF